MDIEYQPSLKELKDGIDRRLKNLQWDQRLLIGIYGIPGSGKTTLSLKLKDYLNQTDEICQIIPMDGYHLYKHELSEFQNSAEMFARRGAHFTFNPSKLLALIQNLKLPIVQNVDYYAPSFNHSIGDPIENDIKISPNHRIIIIEGLYLGLGFYVWKKINSLLNFKCLLNCDLDESKSRIIKRHLSSGIETSAIEAEKRVNENDLLNAKFVLENSLKSDLMIK